MFENTTGKKFIPENQQYSRPHNILLKILNGTA